MPYAASRSKARHGEFLLCVQLYGERRQGDQGTRCRIPVKEPKLWLNAIGRKDFNLEPHTVICSQHFVGAVRCTPYQSIVTCSGLKSENLLSPTYTPSIFSFTPSPKKRRAEQGFERYEAAKRRQEEKDRTEVADALLGSETGEVFYSNDTTTVATQTDLTAIDLSALEEDNRRRTAEIAELRVAKGHPSQEN